MPTVKIWIDLDNTPHVPFFVPIIQELERRGHQISLSARDAFQVCELADEMGLRYIKVGRHYGKNLIMKVIGLLWRSFELLPFCLYQRPALALSHGARAQILLCNLLRIPTVLIDDYEHSRTIPLALPKWMIVPDSIPIKMLPLRASRIRRYRGIKEDVYVPSFSPDPAILKELNLSQQEIIVTVRPPANEAHYYNPESDNLLTELMARICGTPGVRAVLLPRNLRQERVLRATYPNWFKDAKIIVPLGVLNGLNLLWFSDCIVSGGGTMNREAAALNIPVYSIFRGKLGAVDRSLERAGRLVMINNVEEIWRKINFVHRDRNRQPDKSSRPALLDIVGHVEDIMQIEHGRAHIE